jgi:septum formation protein
MNRQLILASSSPRRSELLKQLGLEFRTIPCKVEETSPPGMNPSDMVEMLAARKARAVAALLDDGIVIGADTVVVLDNQALGKPADLKDSVEMLPRLQGKSHEVYTGVALADAGRRKIIIDHAKTRVYFKPLQEAEIRKYVSTGEPLDKAGAYAVQGLAAMFITRLEGCYTNVVGLPLAKLADMLQEFGYRVL